MQIQNIKKRSIIFCLPILLLTCFYVYGFAQQNIQEEPAVRISTELVQFDVTVEDGNGNIVKNLKPEDFEIYEDKERQEINNFSFIDVTTSSILDSANTKTSSNQKSSETINKNLQPNTKSKIGRTIAIVVDEIAIPTDTIGTIRSILKKFVDTQMQPNDLVTIVKTGATTGGLQQFTSNKQLLYSAIEEIKGNITNLNRSGVKSVPSVQIPGGGFLSVNPLGSFRTSVSQIKVVIDALKQLPGRKSLVLLSSEFPGVFLTNTAEANQELNSLIEVANRASVVCYTSDARGNKFLGLTAQDDIDFEPIFGSSGTDQNGEAVRILASLKPEIVELARKGLRVLASSTGGVFSTDSETGIATTLKAQQGYYLIGYIPKKLSFSSKDVYHHLSVKVKNPNLVVRTRKGFYSIDDRELKKLTPEEEIVKTVTSAMNTNKINLKVNPVFTYDKTVGNILNSTIYVDCANLSFVDEAQGAKKLSLETTIYIFNQNGNLLSQISHKNNVTIPEQRYQSFVNSGFAFSLNTSVKEPGTYQLRIVVKDLNNNNLGTIGQVIVVPDTKAKLSLSGLTLVDEPNAKPENSNKQSALLALATHKFKSGSTLVYNTHLYNLKLEASTKKPNLKIQVIIYKDNEVVSTKDVVLETTQENLDELLVEGKLALTEELAPGKYTFQVLVTDLANENQVQTQETEFEVV